MDKEYVDKYNTLFEQVNSMENEINDRIDEILRLICKHLGPKYRTFYYCDAPEDGIGSLHNAMKHGDSIYYILECKGVEKLSINGKFYGNSMPKDFLYMSNEDICKYLDQEVAIHQENLYRTLEKAREREIERNAREERELYERLKVKYGN